jgi:DNA-binding response OmpR family regulator
MLPTWTAPEVCRRIAGQNSGAPSAAVLMLTAKGDRWTVSWGLELGADYLPKPLSPANCWRALRRAAPGAEVTMAPAVSNGHKVMTFVRWNRPRCRTVTVSGALCELTSYQFDLPGLCDEPAVLSRDQIMEACAWPELEAFDRSIDVAHGRIRGAIELDPKDPNAS